MPTPKTAIPTTTLNPYRSLVDHERIEVGEGGVGIVRRFGRALLWHAPGDRDFRIRWRPKSEAEYMAAQRMVRLYPRLTVSTREGVFVAAPEKIDIRSGEATLTLLVLEQRT